METPWALPCFFAYCGFIPAMTGLKVSNGALGSTVRGLTVALHKFATLPSVERGRTPLLWLRNPC
jgi:hypothetical protein